jgi:choline-phosphate cytidylyltransferase
MVSDAEPVDMLDEQGLQPVSRDASAEEGDTTAPESTGKHRKTDSVGSHQHPPLKRQRANSERAADVDQGEPSDDTTEGSGADDELDHEKKATTAKSMAPPPIGKLTHPHGYRTNDPPVGRPVRVYADGVLICSTWATCDSSNRPRKPSPTST